MMRRRIPERILQGTLIALAICALGSAAVAPRAQHFPRANTIVSPQAFVSLAPAPRGRAVEVAVAGKILDGFHINSHEPLDEYLIPTELEVDAPAGFKAQAITYPPGQMKKFTFSKSALSVYAGSFVLRMKIQVLDDAPLGKQNFPMVLHYQACNDQACLPPVKLPVSVELEVAAAGTTAKPIHPEIFSAAPVRSH